MIDTYDADQPSSRPPAPAEPNVGEASFTPAQYAASHSDADLIDWLVADQVWTVHLQRAWRQNPLAQSPLTPAGKSRLEAVWAECPRRGLDAEVNERVRRAISQSEGPYGR